MKRISLSLTILLLISLTGSLSCHGKMEAPSQFLQSFSLAKTIERMNVQELRFMNFDVGQTQSVGPPTSLRRESDSLFTIVESKIENFDDSAILSQLRDNVSQEISNAGLKVTGDGSTAGGIGRSFNIEYESSEFKGAIDVIGVRTAKDQYRLWCLVREIDFGKKRL